MSDQTKSLDSTLMRRREHDDSKTFDLPRLPVRTTHERRPRLPPTLSGLYQPPPSAGLLPSISVERPEPDTTLKSPDSTIGSVAGGANTTTPQTAESGLRPSKIRASRNKWTGTETEALLQGVARFGIGNWTKILLCSDYEFGKRTALDLKDRFRVCCPDQYGSSTRRTKSRCSTDKLVKVRGSSRSPIVNLVDLGFQVPFERSSRRRRHAYTDAEDEQLLKGFQKYGKSWSSIQQDISLGLGHRTRTDLRDRMRTKFPLQLNSLAADSSKAAAGSPQSLEAKSNIVSVQRSPVKQAPAATSSDQHAISWLGSDPYLTVAFDDAEFDEPITLDRGILDWPLSNTAFSQSPRPAQGNDVPSASRPPGNASALPSLATITAPTGQQYDQDREILELPALAQFFVPPLDMDDRNGAHAFLSLDELLR